MFDGKNRAIFVSRKTNLFDIILTPDFMKKKILSGLLIFLAIFLFATWQYRLLSVLLLVMVNKKWLKSRRWMNHWKYSYRALVCALLLGIFIAIPNYFQRGRTQLIYLDKQGERTCTPLHLYLVNAIFPEEEIVNFGIKASAILPADMLSPVFQNLGSRYIKELQDDIWAGKFFAYYKPYNNLSLNFSNPGSFTFGQAIEFTFFNCGRDIAPAIA